MERLTRRNILGAASGFAGGALLAGTAEAATGGATTVIDPILDLIDECDRLTEEAVRIGGRADTILFAMPEDIRWGPSVLLPDLDDDRFTEIEKRLALGVKRLLPDKARHILTTPKSRSFICEDALRQFIEWEQMEPERAGALLAEWRADKDRIDRAKEQAGYTALRREADALHDQANVLLDQIWQTPPRTIAGVIAQIEMTAFETDPYIGNALAGLRALAAGGVA